MMIDIQVLDRFGAAAVAGCPVLKDHILVANEAELKNWIEQVKFPLLVCVLPKAKGDDRNLDNYAEQNDGIFYVLDHYDEQMTRVKRLEVWARTQQGMKEFKEFVMDQCRDGEFFEMLQDADFGNRDIDPEYNMLGNIGWSLMFFYTTDGV